MKQCGIYAIINRQNGKRYYGKTVDMKGRWKQHRTELRGNRHPNPPLQNAWNKYGEWSFLFLWIETVPVERLEAVEQMYLDINRGKGYNIATDSGAPGLGRKPSAETRRKMSEAQKRIGNRPPSSKGLKRSDEHKRQISDAQKGRKKPPHVGVAVGESNKRRTGKKDTPEVCRKRSEALKGKRKSPEHVQHMREAVIRYYEEKRQVTLPSP